MSFVSCQSLMQQEMTWQLAVTRGACAESLHTEEYL
jgi:hypothetical protein